MRDLSIRPGRDPGLALALLSEAAHRLQAPPDGYRRSLVEAAQRALGVPFAVVATFPANQPSAMCFSYSDGPARSSALEFATRHFVPLIARGYDPLAPAAERGPVFDTLPEPDRDVRRVRAAMDRLAVAPVGGRSATSTLFTDHDGRFVGWLVAVHLEPIGAVLRRHETTLSRFGHAVGTTLGAAAALAAEQSAPALALHVLTARERQIAELLAEGLSDLNVSARLGITEATVGTHVHRIFRKLGVHSRVQLTLAMKGLAP